MNRPKAKYWIGCEVAIECFDCILHSTIEAVRVHKASEAVMYRLQGANHWITEEEIIAEGSDGDATKAD